MDRSGTLLTAALTRPMNLAAPCVGLVLSLTFAPWWFFVVSIAAYALMVVLSVRDPAFIERALSGGGDDVGERIDWEATLREFGPRELTDPLTRIQRSEEKLTSELAAATEASRASRDMIASNLAQLRSAARLGIELARKVRRLDFTIRTYEAMDPERRRSEADEKRRRADAASDPEARRAFLDAAKSLEESAAGAESMRRLRERTMAQLESLSVSLESVAVRTIHLRVSSGGDAAGGDVADALRVDLEAVKETLSTFEEDVAFTERARGEE